MSLSIIDRISCYVIISDSQIPVVCNNKVLLFPQNSVAILVCVPPSHNGSVLEPPCGTCFHDLQAKGRKYKKAYNQFKKKKKSLLESITSVQILLTEINQLPSLNSKRQRHATLPLWQERRELEIFMRSYIL